MLFNLNLSWFAYSFMTVYHRANLKAMAIKNWNDWNAVILHTVRITYVWHDGTTVISRLYEWKFSEICSLQAYYTAYSDNSVPTFRGGITTVRCIISQKGADLMYINAESWNHNKFSDFCYFWRHSLLFLVIFSTRCWQQFCDVFDRVSHMAVDML